MELKKSEKADLENKKGLFLQIGLVLALALTLLAFEWKSYDKTELDLGQQVAAKVDEDVVINTQQNQPPPPPPQQQVQTTVLNIVENDVEVESDLEINAEADANTVNQNYTPVMTDEPEPQETEIFTVVEEEPSFPGGEAARKKFLSENIKYPPMAKEAGIQGRVFVTFVVEKDGSITDVKVLRGIGGGCDEEAVRVVKLMPKWQPGKQRNKAVRVQFNMPIDFKLLG